MKKHIFAFMCIFMLLFNTFAYNPTKAMDIGVAIDVGSDVLYYGWDMLNSLLNGFSISLQQYSGYADKAAAMGAYYDDWGIVLSVLTQGYLTPGEVEEAAIGLNTVYPLDFGMSNAVMRDFINQYGGFAYDPSLGMYADINMKSIASWNRYQDKWVKRYLDAFNKNIEDHPENPDPFYQSFLDNINGHETGQFFWYNINGSLGDALGRPGEYTNVGFFGDMPNQYSWCCIGSNNIISNNGYSTSYFVYPLDLSAINIIQSGSTYSFDFSANIIPGLFGSASAGDTGVRRNGGQFEYLGNGQYWLGGFWDANASNFNLSYSGSLGECLSVIQTYMRNISIYVNGELWDYVGTVQNPVVLSPDVITNEVGDIIGNDVWFPEQDLKSDLVKFTELIDDKILTGDTLTIDDVIDAGVLTDTEGNIITDENRDEYLIKKSVSTVIADALDDDPTAGLVPNAPNPPSDDPWNWNFPTIVIPEGGDVNPRRTGLSVLARIVNVTNQGLPPELITMFWGIVITLLILGIIKILHK